MFIFSCRMQVLPPRRKKFARWPKSFPSMSKNNEENVEVLQKLPKKTFFSKLFPWLRTIRFWQPFRERFASRLQTFPLISENDQKEYIFFCKRVFLTNKLLWSLTMQIWQTCWEFFATRPKNCSLDVQNWCNKWNFFKKKIYPKCPNGHVEFNFYNSAHNTIAQCPRMVEILQFLEKIYLSQKCSQDHVQCSFHNPADNFFPGGRKFFAHCP